MKKKTQAEVLRIIKSNNIYLALDTEKGRPGDLSDCDLTGIRIPGTKIIGMSFANSKMNGMDLSGCTFSSCYMSGAKLTNCELQNTLFSSCSLRDVDFSGSDLSDARFSATDLSEADFFGATMRCVTLGSSTLRGVANLPTSVIDVFKKDMLYVLMHSPKEVPALKKALLAGRIGGACYVGECCCLIGTLAKADGGLDEYAKQLPFYHRGLENPCEVLFYQIQMGDTPSTNQFSKIALDVIEYYEKWYNTSRR
jgi:hypothetical protein